jgi:two-component system NtrC family sensor kinase
VRTYYSEFFPYPDQLVTWVIGTQVDLHALATPFSRVRIVILTVALLALLSSLALARIGAKLSGKLADFARRRQPQPIHVAGPDEIRRAGAAFNEVISSFEQAERECDQARTEMLQKAKLASVGQMAAGIGHEINNPLHNILTLTKLMNRHHPDLDKELR